jgi:hypothetical protein
MGQATVSNFQTVARNVCTPLPACALPQRGTITCPGGGDALRGLMPPWCPDGSRTKVRDRMLVYQIVETTDPRTFGKVTLRFNLDLDSTTFSGHIWGTYLIEVAGRGSWDGMFEGDVVSDTKWIYRVIMFGSGEFERLQLRADGIWQAGQGDRLTGYILEPASVSSHQSGENAR